MFRKFANSNSIAKSTTLGIFGSTVQGFLLSVTFFPFPIIGFVMYVLNFEFSLSCGPSPTWAFEGHIEYHTQKSKSPSTVGRQIDSIRNCIRRTNRE